jgi:hypothetical protein
MTDLELNQKLIEFSPFQYIGGTEHLLFNGTELLIDGTYYDNYKIVDSVNGLKIELLRFLPFQQNVLVDFGDEEQAIIVNHQTQNLLNYPKDLRHLAATEGYFILKTLKVDK